MVRIFGLAILLAFVLALLPAPSASACSLTVKSVLPNIVQITGCGQTASYTIPELLTGRTVGPINLPTVTLPPVVGPTKIIRIPGPTKTRTAVRYRLRTRTVTVPGPTTRVTLPGKTKTKPVLVVPPTVTRTVAVYKTVYPKIHKHMRSRQPMPIHAKMGQHNGSSGFFSPTIDWGDHHVTAGEVGLSLLTLIALGLGGLFLMYLGYYVGYKDSERADTNFMRALRDQMSLRR